MDLLSSHKVGRVSGLIEERGCELVYRPPYSPDLNPLEEALPRKFEACTHEALVEAMGRALDAVTRGFFEHRGYRIVGRLL
jgi:transposase